MPRAQHRTCFPAHWTGRQYRPVRPIDLRVDQPDHPAHHQEAVPPGRARHLHPGYCRRRCEQARDREAVGTTVLLVSRQRQAHGLGYMLTDGRVLLHTGKHLGTGTDGVDWHVDSIRRAKDRYGTKVGRSLGILVNYRGVVSSFLYPSPAILRKIHN